MGYNCGAADGKFGDKTLKATKNFQTKYQLEADGIVGAKSLAMAQDCVNRLLVIEIPQPTPQPISPPKKAYIGAWPNWTELSGNIITTTAKKLSYGLNTNKSKYT